MSFSSRVFATSGLFLVTAMPLAGQERFTQIKHTVRAGDMVFVTDETGTETRGRVAGVQPWTLRLTVDGADREWPAAAVVDALIPGRTLVYQQQRSRRVAVVPLITPTTQTMNLRVGF